MTPNEIYRIVPSDDREEAKKEIIRSRVSEDGLVGQFVPGSGPT